MKKKINSSIAVLLVVFILVVAAVVCVFVVRQSQTVNRAVTVDYLPRGNHDKTLTVVADEDYDPYTFIDEKGNPSGHDIEMIYMLGDEMGYNIEIKMLPWNDAIKAVREGKADLILTLAYSPDEYPDFNMSVPIVNDQFVAFGYKPYNYIGDLYGKKLAVLKGTGVVSEFIKPYHLESNTVFFSSTTEAFESVILGECDYVLARYSVGRRAAANLAADNIRAVGPTLVNNYMCIGMPQGATYADEVDSAVISAFAEGKLAALSEKWLGHYVQTLTFGEFVKENMYILIIIACLLVVLFVVAFSTVTRKMNIKKEAVLKRLAERDQLTGLYNRATCEGMIREFLHSSDRESDRNAMLVIDLDNFKMVNDSFGHMIGDSVLIKFSRDLERLVGTDGIVGRLGGDEFFVFLKNCASVDNAVDKANSIVRLFANKYQLGDNTFDISVSVGAAMFPTQGIEFNELYKSADEALYTAKRGGKNGYAYYVESGAMVFRGFNEQ